MLGWLLARRQPWIVSASVPDGARDLAGGIWGSLASELPDQREEGLNGERIFASWNQRGGWLRQVEGLRWAA
jgi:hypothetical protein